MEHLLQRLFATLDIAAECLKAARERHDDPDTQQDVALALKYIEQARTLRGNEKGKGILIAKPSTASQILKYLETWVYEQRDRQLGPGQTGVDIDHLVEMESWAAEILELLPECELPNGCGEDTSIYENAARLFARARLLQPSEEPKEREHNRKHLVVIGERADGVLAANVYSGATLMRQVFGRDEESLAAQLEATGLDLQVLTSKGDGSALFDVDTSDNQAQGAAQ